MDRKLVVRSDNDEVWVINLDDETVRKLTDPEREKMVDSLVTQDPAIKGVQNAILGDDITERDPTGTEKMS